jgi:ABC-2 type transport system permease protein
VNKILAIIYKDLRIRFTSKVEWLFFIILPIVFILVLSGGTGPSGDQRIHLQVVDQAESDLSASLFAELEKSPSVKPVLTPLKEAEADFESRQVSAILIVPETFTTGALQKGEAEIVFRQQQNKINALIDQQAVQVAVGRLSSLVEIADTSVELIDAILPSVSAAEKQQFFDQAFTQAQALMTDAPQRVKTIQGETEDSINYDPRANSTFGQMITWVFIPLIGLSAMFAGEREWGTLRRLLITPTSKALYIGGTVIGQVLTAVLQMAILVTFGMLVLRINFGGSILALLIMIITSALSAAALGTMLGTFVKTENQGNGLSIMIGMVMAMMGGCWYPIELFPASIQNVVRVLPTTWAMQGFLDVAVRGQGVPGILLEGGVLLGFALLFFGIGVWRFRYE